MVSKSLNYLSLARKGGMAELGEEPVGDISRTGKAYAILVASDASEHTWRRAKAYAAGTEQQCIRLPYSKAEMGEAIGRESLAIAAITDAPPGPGNAAKPAGAGEIPKEHPGACRKDPEAEKTPAGAQGPFEKRPQGEKIRAVIIGVLRQFAVYD